MSSTESGISATEADQLVALHSTIVETATASEMKRQSVSVTSTALISAGVAIFAADRGFSFVYLVVPFLIISSIWFVTVRFYQQLSKSKWKVIHEIEEKLVLAPFKREWNYHENSKGRFTYGPSTIEQVIPALIFVASLAYGLYWICKST